MNKSSKSAVETMPAKCQCTTPESTKMRFLEPQTSTLQQPADALGITRVRVNGWLVVEFLASFSVFILHSLY